ncbi:DUF6884 domain-containing protein [Streptacidiphilus sp. EB103A]|uniref:DUF6884 domain-containing protein n=1 Tax=Streptacidiphilus sp. EB103A TaxID=3156275 RepID=UPI003512E405
MTNVKPDARSRPRWDEVRARSALAQLPGGEDLVVCTDGWRVRIVRGPVGELPSWEAVAGALEEGGFVGVCPVPDGVVASAAYPSTALTRRLDPAWEFTEQVSFLGQPDERVGGTVKLHANYASCSLVAKDVAGREVGRGFRDRFVASQALAAHHGLPLPLRSFDEDHFDLIAQFRDSALEVTAAAQRSALKAAVVHPYGDLPLSTSAGDLAFLLALGLVGQVPGPVAAPGRWVVTREGRRTAALWPPEKLVLVPCSGRKLDATAVASAGEMYAPGSYHRAARRAAEAMTAEGGRWMILSARYGLLDPHDRILAYDLKAGRPGTVGADTLSRQAHQAAVSTAQVTVLAGAAYGELARGAWPSVHQPLAGLGIGRHLAYFADRYEPGRRPRPRRRPRPAVPA